VFALPRERGLRSCCELRCSGNRKIASALAKRLTPVQVDLPLLPLGTGRHVDHGTVLDAALPFGKLLPCGFYKSLINHTRVVSEEEQQTLLDQVGAR